MMTVKEGGGHFSRRSFFFYGHSSVDGELFHNIYFKVTVALSLTFISKNGFPLEI